MPMLTRIAGCAVRADVVDGKFTVVGIAPNGDEVTNTHSTDNAPGNYSKVIALNETMRPLIEYVTHADADFPFLPVIPDEEI